MNRRGRRVKSVGESRTVSSGSNSIGMDPVGNIDPGLL